MQWHQDPNQSNLKREVSRYFMNKRNEYMKAKINEYEINSEIKNIRDLYRGTSDFKIGYPPRTNTVKNEKGDLVTNSHSILARWRKHFSQLLNVHRVSDDRQTETHTAELLEPGPSALS